MERVRLVVAEGVPSIAVRWRDVPAALGIGATKCDQLRTRGLIKAFELDGMVFVRTQDLVELVDRLHSEQHGADLSPETAADLMQQALDRIVEENGAESPPAVLAQAALDQVRPRARNRRRAS